MHIFCYIIMVDVKDLEPISDDELYVSQFMGPVMNKQPNYEDIINDEQPSNYKLLVDDVELISNEDNEFILHRDEQIKPIEDFKQTSTAQKQKSAHQRRSLESKQRRNRKRNITHRMRRYQHYITRPIYSKFNMPLVTKILKKHDIKYVHVKVVNELLIIGLKHDMIKQKYKKQIPGDMFDRTNYYIYRSHHQQHRKQQQ